MADTSTFSGAMKPITPARNRLKRKRRVTPPKSVFNPERKAERRSRRPRARAAI